MANPARNRDLRTIRPPRYTLKRKCMTSPSATT